MFALWENLVVGEEGEAEKDINAQEELMRTERQVEWERTE